jgi:hypothetical protein
MEVISKLYNKAMECSEPDFKDLFGVTKTTYEAMLAQVRVAYVAKHQKRGRKPKLALEDILFMALKYWRQYVTQKALAFEFEIGETTVHDRVVWVENVLVKSGKFRLPGKKALRGDTEIKVVLVDVSESPIERPKKNSENGIRAKRNTIL